LRQEKCEFFLTSVEYLGFIFDVSGRHPDPKNIRAIQQMPTPKDVPPLRSFLGLITYYSAFLPSMHNVRPPLNYLLGKDVPWVRSSECGEAVCQLQSMLSSDLLQTHYDPADNDRTEVETSDKSGSCDEWCKSTKHISAVTAVAKTPPPPPHLSVATDDA
uniref:RT_RNaseH_2 domain-containing protein n=1 Tax=Mesocestoides corti TaxID=53468 RepID=A0A0R3UQ82_MESCO